jgi:hypothetical protein
VNLPFSRARRADRRTLPAKRRGWFGALIRPLRGGEKVLRSRTDHDASRWICAGAPSGSHVSFWIIADFVARRASPETVARLTTRNTVSRTSVVAGRTTLPWGRRERQRDGSAAGGHSHFFRHPIAAKSAPQSAIRLHLMRDPVSLPLARPRERAGPLAFREFARSRIRCSWRLGPVRFRLASSLADAGDEHEGVSSKKFSWPLTASAPSAQPDVRRRCPTRNEEMLCRLRECRRTTAEPRRRTIAGLACNQIGEEPKRLSFIRSNGGTEIMLPLRCSVCQFFSGFGITRSPPNLTELHHRPPRLTPGLLPSVTRHTGRR